MNIDYIMHLDEQLTALVTTYGAWTYLFLSLLIFCETAIILIAFLPGDSLLFATGALTASLTGVLNIHFLFISLVLASVIGNGVNYFIGKKLGVKLFKPNHKWILNSKYLEKTYQF